MRTTFTLVALVATLGVFGCGNDSLNCSTIACSDSSSSSYELCSDDDGDVTYTFGGSSCRCSGYYTGGCASCAQKISMYCGVMPDLSMPDDLSQPRDASMPIDGLSSQDLKGD